MSVADSSNGLYYVLAWCPWDFSFIGSLEVSDSKAQEQLFYWWVEGFWVSCPLALGQEWFLLFALKHQDCVLCQAETILRGGLLFGKCPNLVPIPGLSLGPKGTPFSTQCRRSPAVACGPMPSEGPGVWWYLTWRPTPCTWSVSGFIKSYTAPSF